MCSARPGAASTGAGLDLSRIEAEVVGGVGDAVALAARPWSAGTIGGMVKTTVYLEERDAAALRRMAAETGRSQAQIIREAVTRSTQAAEPRRLRSMAAGRGSGAPVARNADEILRDELGRSAR